MNQKKNNRLFLLDAMALIYRAYYAFIRRPLYNSKGLNTSAIVGFTNTLYDLLQNEDPTHIAVVFDSMEPTERHIEYEEYKANREEMPEDIATSIPYIKEVLKAFHIPVLEEAGYEADDIIGTIAKKAEKEGYTTYMVTSDKDLGQLVSENIFMYKPGRSGKDVEIMDTNKILKKWGIEHVEQLIDILGLQGDSSDNIPGVPGVGKKRAQKLVAKYGSVEKVLEHADEIKGKLGEKIKENAEQARISKQLATIICDVPVEFDEKDLEREKPDQKKLNQLFSDLEFKQLGKRILGDDFTITTKEEAGQMDLFGNNGNDQNSDHGSDQRGTHLEDTDHDYQLVDTAAKRKKLVKKLKKQSSFCFDTETSSLDPSQTELVGLSFSFTPHEGYYVPCPEDQSETRSILEELAPVLTDEKIEKIGHNLKFDMLVLRWYGLKIKGPLYDTMLAHYLVEPDMKHGMDILSETYLNYRPVPIEKLIGKKGKNQGSMRDVSVEKVSEYAAEDADITLQLKEVLEPKLKESELKELYQNIEVPLIPVLTDMEYEGVAVSENTLNDYSKELEADIQNIEKEVFDIAGTEFNLASPKQLGEVLFDKLKLEKNPKKTKSGQYATNEQVLTKLADKHKIARLILDHRELTKLKSTYVDALPQLIHPDTGRIHTTFNQTIAATGRLSSTNPNLQNIPIRTEKGRYIRKAFVPRDKNYQLLSADYSQIELRIIAAISKDENMLNDFKEGLDVHAATASRVFDTPIKEVTPDMRRQAKTVNFGIVYGISPYGLSQRLNIKRKRAKKLIDQYFAKYTGIKKYMDDTIELARKQGYVTTIMGRRRYLKDINSKNATVRSFAERTAINAPIQGSAADVIKKAMIDIYKTLSEQNYQTKMTLQVHDELVFDAHKDEIDEIEPLITKKMQKAVSLDVPIEVETGRGKNWLEAH